LAITEGEFQTALNTSWNDRSQIHVLHLKTIDEEKAPQVLTDLSKEDELLLSVDLTNSMASSIPSITAAVVGKKREHDAKFKKTDRSVTKQTEMKPKVSWSNLLVDIWNTEETEDLELSIREEDKSEKEKPDIGDDDLRRLIQKARDTLAGSMFCPLLNRNTEKLLHHVIDAKEAVCELRVPEDHNIECSLLTEQSEKQSLWLKLPNEFPFRILGLEIIDQSNAELKEVFEQRGFFLGRERRPDEFNSLVVATYACLNDSKIKAKVKFVIDMNLVSASDYLVALRITR
jgi:hypothetical protein